MQLFVFFIGVRGKQESYDTMVKALYGHSRVYGKVEGGDDEFVAVIRTEREDYSSAQYNAQCQADRLRSFVQWKVVGPYEMLETLNEHEDFYGIIHSLERV